MGSDDKDIMAIARSHAYTITVLLVPAEAVIGENYEVIRSPADKRHYFVACSRDWVDNYLDGADADEQEELFEEIAMIAINAASAVIDRS